MTMPSRGVSPIQKQARGKTTMADKRKAAAPKNVAKKSIKVERKVSAPLDAMSVGAANSLPMGGAAGMKAGGSACKGMYKGGKVDGCVSKGRTKGKFV